MRWLPVVFVVCIIVCLYAFVASGRALTTQEVLLLKQNGVSERTIQLMMHSEVQEKNRAASSIRITEDESSKTYATGKPSSTPLTREEQLNVERAWEMLKNLTLEFEQ